ncbi:MAG TPA: hypothetical protein PLY45_04670 [bacterium]|nr:hypothetical protein [bacterium]
MIEQKIKEIVTGAIEACVAEGALPRPGDFEVETDDLRHLLGDGFEAGCAAEGRHGDGDTGVHDGIRAYADRGILRPGREPTGR